MSGVGAPDGETLVTTGDVAAFVVRTLADGEPLNRIGIVGLNHRRLRQDSCAIRALSSARLQKIL